MVAQICNLACDQELPLAFACCVTVTRTSAIDKTAKIDRHADAGIDGRGRRRDRDDRRPGRDRRRGHDHQADKDKSWGHRAAKPPSRPRRTANFGEIDRDLSRTCGPES